MAGQPTLLLYTWRKGRRFPTKGEAKEALKAWKERYEQDGWTVTGSADSSYIAFAPDFEGGDFWLPHEGEPNPKVHSAGIRADDGTYAFNWTPDA